MQRLHLVGFTTDHEALIFSARKGSRSGGYVVPLDEDLLATIEEIQRLDGGEEYDDDADHGVTPGEREHRPRRRPPRPDSTLSPREIQTRIRAGRSVADVAAEAGVDEDWVERFAVPVMAEKARVVAAARELVYSKPRLGPSSLPLGTAVAWNIADKGVSLSSRQFDDGWTAYQLLDGAWVVRFSYSSRGRAQHAEWELEDQELVSRNRLASELGYVERGRRRRQPVFRLDDSADETDPAAVAGKPTRRKAVRKAGARKASRPASKKRAPTRAATKKRPKAPARATTKKRAPTRAATKKQARVAKVTPASGRAGSARATTTVRPSATARTATRANASTRPSAAARGRSRIVSSPGRATPRVAASYIAASPSSSPAPQARASALARPTVRLPAPAPSATRARPAPLGAVGADGDPVPAPEPPRVRRPRPLRAR
ncbi:MAG: septation protein SepH [Acidimicrobiales bacterium]